MRRPVILLFFLLGAWCAATVFMWQTAIQNFAVAASVQASGEAGLREAVGDLTDEDLRLILRHQASETNRLFFRGWGWIQIPLATAVLFLAWKFAGGRLVTAASAATLGIALLLAAYVVPGDRPPGTHAGFRRPGRVAGCAERLLVPAQRLYRSRHGQAAAVPGDRRRGVRADGGSAPARLSAPLGGGRAAVAGGDRP